MGFPWYFYDISLGLLLDFYGMPVVFLWDPYGISMVSIGFLWYFHDVSMIFLEDFYGDSYGISLRFLCYSMLCL